MQILPYSTQNAFQWDEFVSRAPMATLLHSRRFLSYHGDRFKDKSLLIKDGKNELVGLFPAAVDPLNEDVVVSHPGVTYGGIIHEGGLRGERMLEAFLLLWNSYIEQGFNTLRYKAVPHIYHRAPSSDDLYALYRFGAVRYRCDLSCAIDLSHRLKRSTRRMRGLKKALKNGVQLVEGFNFAEQLWRVIEDNLFRKYKLKPVHSFNEITHLYSLFPNEIKIIVALIDAQVVAGTVLFSSPNVQHAQYTASSAIGYETSALDAVFEYCIENSKSQGVRYFNFGVSTENGGQYLNADLYQFKSEFGAGGVLHEFFELRADNGCQIANREL